MIPKIHHCLVDFPILIQIRMITVYIFRLDIFLGVRTILRLTELLSDVSLGGILTRQAQTNSALEVRWTLSSLQWQKALPMLGPVTFPLFPPFFQDVWPFSCWTFRTLQTHFKLSITRVLQILFFHIRTPCVNVQNNSFLRLKVPKMHIWLNKGYESQCYCYFIV